MPTSRGKAGQGSKGRMNRLLGRMVDWTEAASKGLHPAQVAGLGYLAYTLLGWLLLCLPFAQKLPEGIPAIDNLFIATSAVSTTGLVTVSVVDSYNAFGQVVVLMLIQLGGLGYMTFGSFVILSTKGGLSAERSRVGRTVFSLPESFRIDKFIRSVVVFTVVIEAAGALALYAVFRRADAATPLWSAVFHSVSAFCTAGFSLYDTSFEAFAGDFWLNLVISALSYCGAIGFIVWVDYWRKLTGKVQQVTLTSRIILWMSLWLTVVSTFMIFVGEPSLDAKPVEDKLLESFFQAMTAMTTVGFNTIPTASLSSATLLVIIALMIIGASPSGTGGGVKSTTVSALIGVMRSTLRGDAEVRFRKKVVPRARVWTATANMGFYMLMLLVGTYLLELTQRAGFVENIFEAASALGTVGLSMGITASLSGLGKLVVILLMFCGRLGPLTFGMALFFKSHKGSEASDNDLAV